jgi:DNA polymerase III delta prime subunit
MRKYENTGSGDQINIENVEQFIAAPIVLEKRDAALEAVLGKVQQEIKERLEQSLHRATDATLLNLSKTLNPHQVLPPLAKESSVQGHPPELLPPEQMIAEVFESSGKRLLILGEPGSGKTTTLLELGKSLVDQALRKSDAPIPILVDLSSWQDSQQSIFDWLVEQLKSKYGVLNKNLGRKLLSEKCFLPLLDGLDEVAPVLQKNCVDRLNVWLTEDVKKEPIGVIICCRIREYEEIIRQRLFLNNSVRLLPLEKAQIEDYLSQIHLDEVWEIVKTSISLQDFLSIPLFLSIFGLVATTQQFDIQKWQNKTTDADRWTYLLDLYWDVVMERQLVINLSRNAGNLSKTYGRKPLPSRKVVRKVLIFAASAMEKESLSELLIEKLQPNWLNNQTQKRQYKNLSGLIGWLLFGIFTGTFAGIVIFAGLIGHLSLPIHSVNQDGPISNLNLGSILEAILGPILEPILGSILGVILGLIPGLILGLILGIFSLVLEPFSIYLSGNSEPIEIIESFEDIEPVQISISNFTQKNILLSLKIYLIYGLIGGLAGGAILGMFFGKNTSQIISLIRGNSSSGMILPTKGKGLGFILFLLVTAWNISQNSRQISVLFSGQDRELIVGIICGISFGMLGGIIYGIIGGLKASVINSMTPNQGMKNSCQNMLIFSMAALFVGLLFKLILEHFLVILPYEAISKIASCALFSLILCSFYQSGGRVLAQHITLRIVLALHGYAPYRYDKLLDYCTERLLLQRIGGRYRFMHKLLQEHFAKMPLD